MLDFFTRRREIQQNIKLAIANGEARKVLEVEPPEEDFAAFYLDSMLQSLYRTAAKINTDMLEIRRDLADSGGNAVLPRVRASSPTEIVAAGAAADQGLEICRLALRSGNQRLQYLRGAM
ncbi:MAG: hypothetical protein ACOX2P_05580 [Bacillota bacterium]